MPQLDNLIIIDQIIGFMGLFIIIYFFISQFFLPYITALFLIFNKIKIRLKFLNSLAIIFYNVCFLNLLKMKGLNKLIYFNHNKYCIFVRLLIAFIYNKNEKRQ